MKARESLLIDAWELARQQRSLHGEAPLLEFERLLDGQPQQDPERKVTWTLTGATDGVGRRYTSLQADTVVTLECQRCLGMFDLPLHAESRVQMVETEAELEVEEDFEGDPDAPDRVLGSAQFDAQSLVEDELILALPYVPKHEVCPSLPEALETDEGSDTGRPSPFAALAELKKD